MCRRSVVVAPAEGTGAKQVIITRHMHSVTDRFTVIYMTTLFLVRYTHDVVDRIQSCAIKAEKLAHLSFFLLERFIARFQLEGDVKVDDHNPAIYTSQPVARPGISV
jgi:hypothetical protein